MSDTEPLTKILVGVDLSKASDPIIHFAECLALKYGSELILFYTIDEAIIDHPAAGFDPESLIEAYVRKAKEYLEEKVEELRKRGITARYKINDRPSDPAHAIYEEALEERASEILVGHKGRRLLKIIPIGSTALTLVNISTIPVILVKPSQISEEKIEVIVREGTLPRDVFERVVVAIDSNASEEMLHYFGRVLSKRTQPGKKEVYLVHVVEHNESEVHAKKLLSRAEAILKEYGLKVKSMILQGKPSKTISSLIEQLGATSLMVGRTRKKKRFIEYIVGTTLWRLIVYVDVPILVYPLAADEGNGKKLVLS